MGTERPTHLTPSGPRSPEAGFTLIELAVVIAIIGFLLGAILIPLSTQVQATKIKETERTLEEIRRALIGYSLAQGATQVLPCPDNPADGIDGRGDGTPGACATDEGILPWLDLGVKRDDAWGRLFVYRVAEDFTDPAAAGSPCNTPNVVDLCDTGPAGAITVNTRGDDPGTGSGGELKERVALTTTAPAVVISLGANGAGGRTVAAPTVVLANPTGADELENTNGNATFISRRPSKGANGCDDADEATAPLPAFCEFDDIVMWLSTPALLGRMVDARLLP